jgi:hypothetical protein
MSQPRRLRTRRPSSVETSARNPSHFSSKDHPEPRALALGERASVRAAAGNGPYWSKPSRSSSRAVSRGMTKPPSISNRPKHATQTPEEGAPVVDARGAPSRSNRMGS